MAKGMTTRFTWVYMHSLKRGRLNFVAEGAVQKQYQRNPVGGTASKYSLERIKAFNTKCMLLRAYLEH